MVKVILPQTHDGEDHLFIIVLGGGDAITDDHNPKPYFNPTILCLYLKITCFFFEIGL